MSDFARHRDEPRELSTHFWQDVHRRLFADRETEAEESPALLGKEEKSSLSLLLPRFARAAGLACVLFIGLFLGLLIAHYSRVDSNVADGPAAARVEPGRNAEGIWKTAHDAPAGISLPTRAFSVDQATVWSPSEGVMEQFEVVTPRAEYYVPQWTTTASANDSCNF